MLSVLVYLPAVGGEPIWDDVIVFDRLLQGWDGGLSLGTQRTKRFGRLQSHHDAVDARERSERAGIASASRRPARAAGRVVVEPFDCAEHVAPLRLERGPAIRMVVGTLVTNLILFGFLWSIGQPLLYLLWLGAWLTTNKLVARIRSIAEHAVVPDPSDPIGQTRTVLAGPFERLFIAPNRVQFHLEHHLLMTVPHYNLPKFHTMLRERGLLEGACVAPGYAQVLSLALRPAAQSPA